MRIVIKRGARMRVVVDLNRCLGYAQCVFLAPSVFKLNGEEALQYDPNPDDAARSPAREAPTMTKRPVLLNVATRSATFSLVEVALMTLPPPLCR